MTIIIDGTVGANKAVVLDSAGKLPAIDGSLVTTLNATQVTTGSIATARIDTGTTTGKVLVLDGSGNMPAIAAGSMTGVSSATKSASDPTVSTNPATGLGTKWINTTSGEIFICTDATAGENVWTSSGGTSGNVEPWTFHGGGTAYGFTTGGGPYQSIERYSFASDGNAIDTTYDLLSGTGGEVGGTSSSTHGYVMGAQGSNNIQKFNMTTVANATDVGDLVYSDAHRCAGCMSETYGFASGGTEPNGVNDINRFAFASDGNAVDWGNLTVIKTWHSGCSSATYGYTAGGGAGGSNPINVIDKFPFASSAGSTDVGNLTENAGQTPGGQQSSTYGYRSGGRVTSPNVSAVTIDKFSFTTDGDATDIGDLSLGRFNNSDSSSSTHGYTHGGWSSITSALSDVIDKHSFSTDGNSTDVGNLTAANAYTSGHQI